MKVAIVGATGYTGLELLRILLHHPRVRITCCTSERYAGAAVSEVFPALQGCCDIRLEKLNPGSVSAQADFVFTALPHRESMAVVPLFHDRNIPTVDLSADFRFANRAVYERWYQTHSAPELLDRAVYGLPELNRAVITRSRLVANPGCYPTSIILPLAPFLSRDLISRTGIVADSKSGVSGAGRGLKTGSLYCEAGESFKAYSVMAHRHQPEIEEQLSAISSRPITLTFAPHLVPMNRGMLSTIYVTLKRSARPADIHEILLQQYGLEPFVRILPEGVLPQTGWVRGTNYCDIGFALCGRRLVLVSAIDNLGKGASGQAVQNMNLMTGNEETAGLTSVGLCP